MPEAPGALRTMMEQNALFAIMAVIIVVLARFAYKILMMHLTKLKEDGDIKKTVDEIKKDTEEIKRNHHEHRRS
jgi:hypothetical protein